ncbi:hypothetical protein DYBT9275_01764 [Dyadobacter sp. CECT 9275]|uniref:Universal stress protein n=1 Tax=Dyadobacter helix TaxID=2822344 RepID=A0A916JAX0_9BACT|nr:hypothetical protein [Dyadobacter sp. CECT 9275]CAG4997387.1 hypothetical protein DYBT9275_01764 [Dyadobacter sp. CECT 9275]
MKTVIIPSDFTLTSIRIAEAVIKESHEPVRFVFTHLFHVADDIQDLLFSSYRKKEYDFVPEEFWQECKTIKDLYTSQVSTIRIEFFYGSKLAAFKNFLDYHDADAIAYSETYGIPLISKSSIDALPVIKKAGLPLINVDEIMEPEYLEIENLK